MSEGKIDLQELLRVSTEILAWQRIAYGDKVKPLLEELLDEPRKILAYYHSDGENTTRKISEKVNASTSTISMWWNTWMYRGIAVPIPKGRGFRAKRFFDPEDYGIRIPDTSELIGKGEEKGAD